MTDEHPEVTPFQQRRDLGLKGVTTAAILTPLALGTMALSPSLISNEQAAQTAMTTSVVVMSISATAGLAANQMYHTNEDELIASAALAQEFRALQ